MDVKIIAAVALDGAIGRGNDLLWHIKADMRFFKATTMGHPIIMGRKTFESIGRALPGRLNVVISRKDIQLPEGVVLVHGITEALDVCRQAGCDECFVTGGGQIYAQAMPLADTLLITRVFTKADEADTFFPEIAAEEWEMESQGQMERDEVSGLEFRFETYRRKQ